MRRGLIQEVAFGDATVVEVWEGPVFAENHGMPAEVVGPFIALCSTHDTYVNAASREVVLGLPERCIEWCPSCKQLVEQYRAERQAALEREWVEQERQRLLREQERQAEANRLAFEQAEREAELAKQLYVTSPVEAADLSPLISESMSVVVPLPATLAEPVPAQPRFVRDGAKAPAPVYGGVSVEPAGPTPVSAVPVSIEPPPTPVVTVMVMNVPAQEEVAGSNGAHEETPPSETHVEALLNEAWAFKDRIDALEGELKGVRELFSRKLGELPEATRYVPFMQRGQMHQVRTRGDKYYVVPIKLPKRKGTEGAVSQ